MSRSPFTKVAVCQLLNERFLLNFHRNEDGEQWNKYIQLFVIE